MKKSPGVGRNPDRWEEGSVEGAQSTGKEDPALTEIFE